MPVIARAAQHGRNTVTEYHVEITREMRDKCLAFSSKIKLDDEQYDRIVPRELRIGNGDNAEVIRSKVRLYYKYTIQRTYAGKLGELAFLELLKSFDIDFDTRGMFDIFHGQQNVDRFDFCTPAGESIDIKTGFRGNHRRLMVNVEQVRNVKDYYVGIKLLAEDVPNSPYFIEWDSVTCAVVKGCVSRNELIGTQTNNFGLGNAKALLYSELNGIDELMERFRANRQ